MKSNKNTNSPMGTQAFSLRARQPEVAAFRGDFTKSPQFKAYQATVEWLFTLDNIALNPRFIRGRVPGLKRKPTNPILDYSKRMAWIADQIGWPVQAIITVLEPSLML